MENTTTLGIVVASDRLPAEVVLRDGIQQNAGRSELPNESWLMLLTPDSEDVAELETEGGRRFLEKVTGCELNFNLPSISSHEDVPKDGFRLSGICEMEKRGDVCFPLELSLRSPLVPSTTDDMLMAVPPHGAVETRCDKRVQLLGIARYPVVLAADHTAIYRLHLSDPSMRKARTTVKAVQNVRQTATVRKAVVQMRNLSTVLDPDEVRDVGMCAQLTAAANTELDFFPPSSPNALSSSSKKISSPSKRLKIFRLVHSQRSRERDSSMPTVPETEKDEGYGSGKVSLHPPKLRSHSRSHSTGHTVLHSSVSAPSIHAKQSSPKRSVSADGEDPGVDTGLAPAERERSDSADLVEGLLGWTKSVADRAMDLLRDRSLSHGSTARPHPALKLNIGIADFVRRRSKDGDASSRPVSMVERIHVRSSPESPTDEVPPSGRRGSIGDTSAAAFWRERCAHLEEQCEEVEQKIRENDLACRALQQQVDMETKRQNRGTGTALLKTMSVDEVQSLLDKAHLSQYAMRFREQNVNGHALAAINETVLENRMQIKNRFHRLKIMQLSKGNMRLMTL